MNNKRYLKSLLVDRVHRALGSTLACLVRLYSGIETQGFGLAVVPGLLTWNIKLNLRAWGSGRTHPSQIVSGSGPA